MIWGLLLSAQAEGSGLLHPDRKGHIMKIGTIGTGGIVEWMMAEALRTDGMEWGAVCSRREATGRALADRFGVPRVYTDLDAMLADGELDFIYVASPNSLHYAQARRALLAGKNVICEKPFAPTRAQAEELAALAQEKRLFLFEGITTMFLPNFALIREKLAEIGRVRQVSCTYCQYSSKYDAFCAGETPNVFNPAFAGGALMDINLYNLYFAYGLFGNPQKLAYHAHRHPNGIDTSGVLVMEYPDFVCQCTGAKDCQGENGAAILGEKGRILLHGSANMCPRVTVVTQDGGQAFDLQNGETAWYHEMQGIAKLVAAGDYRACWKRLEDTVAVVGLLEQARRSAGIVFPGIDAV